jgi:hypothetical protein
LTAFTQTDLCDDDALRPIFEACGCGHLFAMTEAKYEFLAPDVKPFAAEIKRYLRMAA